MKMNIFWGDLTGNSAKKEALAEGCNHEPGVAPIRCVPASASFFKINENIVLDTLIQKIFCQVMQIKKIGVR